jgi:CheY-like chemotaxis protein/thioredoxin-like negative regulator of GroEL
VAYTVPATHERVVLLVEDFEVMRGMLKGMLLKCGAKRVDTAATATDALAALQKTTYDAVLCDYNLGDAKNGQMLLEEARYHNWISPSTAWIMITAEKTSDMVSVAAEDAPDDYVLKPITEAALQARLDRLIERKASLAPITRAMRFRDWRQVLKLCEEQLAGGCKAPSDVLRIQADMHQRLGEYQKAHAVYEVVLKRGPIAWAKLGMARMLIAMKKTPAARGLLQDVVRDHPQYVDAYDAFAELLAAEGQHAEELALLERAAKISPNAPARQAALGAAALRQGNREAAQGAFEKAMKLAEHSSIERAEPYLGLARIHSEGGDPGAAEKVLKDLRVRFTSPQTELLAMGEEVRMHRAAGRLDEARELARKLAERAEDDLTPLAPDAAVRLAETLMQAGQSDEGSRLLEFVTRNNHDDEIVVRRAQRVFDEAGMSERGAERLSQARRQATETMADGVRLMAKGDLSGALDNLRGARRLMPQNARVLLNFAAVALTALDKAGGGPLISEVQRALEAAALLRPGDERLLQLQARLAKWL